MAKLIAGASIASTAGDTPPNGSNFPAVTLKMSPTFLGGGTSRRELDQLAARISADACQRKVPDLGSAENRYL